MQLGQPQTAATAVRLFLRVYVEHFWKYKPKNWLCECELNTALNDERQFMRQNPHGAYKQRRDSQENRAQQKSL